MFLKAVIEIVWARRPIVLVATICCLAGGAFVAATFEPRYQAVAKVSLDYIRPDPITGAYVGSKQADAYTKTQMQLVKDVQTAALAAEALGLLDNIDLQSQYAASGGSADGFGAWIGRRLAGSTGVAAIPDSNMIVISYAAPRRDAALAYVDAIRTAYLRALLQSKQRGALQSAKNLSVQADKVAADLAKLEAAKRALQDRGGDEPALDGRKLESLVETVRGLYVEEAHGVPSAMRLAAAEAELEQASRELGPNHPRIAELKAQRDILRMQVARETAAAAGGSSAGAMERARQGELEQVKSRVLAGRLTALDMRLLNEEITQRSDVLKSHNAKIAELRTLSNLPNPGATAIGEPEADNDPVYPNPVLILFGTAFLGMLGGSMLAILIEMLDRRLRNPGDLASSVGSLVLGQLPQARSRQPLRILGARFRRAARTRGQAEVTA